MIGNENDANVVKVVVNPVKRVLIGNSSDLSVTIIAQLENENGQAVSSNGCSLIFSAETLKTLGAFDDEELSQNPTKTVEVDSTGKAIVTFKTENKDCSWNITANPSIKNCEFGTTTVSVETNPANNFKFKLRDMSTLSITEMKVNNKLEIAADNGDCGQTLGCTGYDCKGNLATNCEEDDVTLMIKNVSCLSGLPTASGVNNDLAPSGRANLATVTSSIDEGNDILMLKGTLSDISFYLNDVMFAQNAFGGEDGITAVKTGKVTFALTDDSTGASGSASINII